MSESKSWFETVRGASVGLTYNTHSKLRMLAKAYNEARHKWEWEEANVSPDLVAEKILSAYFKENYPWMDEHLKELKGLKDGAQTRLNEQIKSERTGIEGKSTPPDVPDGNPPAPGDGHGDDV